MSSTQPTVAQAIASAERELVVREQAAGHLRGIPKQQNATTIARLYDRLNALHLQRIEAA